MAKTNKPLINDVSVQTKMPRELRDAAQAKADKNSQNLSELIRKFLRAYVAEK